MNLMKMISGMQGGQNQSEKMEVNELQEIMLSVRWILPITFLTLIALLVRYIIKLKKNIKPNKKNDDCES
jgi:hypothetical protein